MLQVLVSSPWALGSVVYRFHFFLAFTSEPWIVYVPRSTLGSYCVRGKAGRRTCKPWVGLTDSTVQAAQHAYTPTPTHHLPPARREDVLVALVPLPVHHLAWVRLLGWFRMQGRVSDGSERAPHLHITPRHCNAPTSSFSMRVSMVMRTSSCTSKWKSGPDFPRALVTIRS